MKVCIIGIRGEMGDWFRRYYEACPDVEVYGTGRAPNDGPRVVWAHDDSAAFAPCAEPLGDAVRRADLVIVSTPLLDTPKIIRNFAAHSQERQTWCDLASIKGHIFADGAYDALRAQEIVTLHPVFAGHPLTGPVSPKGRLFVFCRHRGERGYRELRDHYAQAGAQIVETSWQDHDRYMAVVQGLTHVNAIALGLALGRLEMGNGEVARFASPVYKLFAAMSQRVLSRNWELYAGIQFANPNTPQVLDTYADAIRSLADVIRQGNHEESLAAFQDLFAQARDTMQTDAPPKHAGEIARILELLSSAY